MLAYGCLGILFLYTAIRAGLYWFRRTSAPTQQDIDNSLLTILNGESER